MMEYNIRLWPGDVCNGLCVCACGFSFSSKLCREEMEQLRREVDLLKSKLSEFRANYLSMFVCSVFFNNKKIVF